MGAYNWINFNFLCPACNNVTTLRSQTHVASDFGGIEDRFCMKTYHIGEKMAWWPPNDKQFKNWRDDYYFHVHKLAENQEEECCYAKCTICKAELYAVIFFEDITPIKIKAVGLEEHWPEGYSK